jgi:hypothetical protein
MLGMVGLLLNWLAALVKSRRRLEKVENLVLRHQVNILRRRGTATLVVVPCRLASIRLAASSQENSRN